MMITFVLSSTVLLTANFQSDPMRELMTLKAVQVGVATEVLGIT